MTTKEVLQAARALIADPKHWTKGAYARDSENHVVQYAAQEVCKRCSSGAVLAVVGFTQQIPEAWMALNDVAILQGFTNIIHLNDEVQTTHADVLSVFDEAIAAQTDA